MQSILETELGIGFTGTQQREMTERQIKSFLNLMEKHLENNKFHHGLCKGCDAHAHRLIRQHFPNTKIVGHPPINKSKMVSLECDEMRAPLPYLKRNMGIAMESSKIFATPFSVQEEQRSGTWATVRYAGIVEINAYIIFPNGSVKLRKPDGSS